MPCLQVLLNAGHEAWHTSAAGRSEAKDASQSDYALNKNAALITHDKEFTARAKEHVLGQHVRLCVEQPFGAETLSAHLDDIVMILERHRDLVIEVFRDSLVLTYPNGGEQTANPPRLSPTKSV